MFGYVTVCKNALSEQGLKTFKAYYCGLCKAIGKRCSQSARLGLSYDITFLAIVLSSVCKNEISMKDKKCVLHPIRENICVENDTALNYAADMGVILTYLKFSINDFTAISTFSIEVARLIRIKPSNLSPPNQSPKSTASLHLSNTIAFTSDGSAHLRRSTQVR